MDMKLEVVVVPVTDVDRAKDFDTGMGWRLDACITADDGLRVIQFTPSGSACSIILGRNVTLDSCCTGVHSRREVGAELVPGGGPTARLPHSTATGRPSRD